MNLPPPHPQGWFCVARSSELRNGRILSRRFMDREIVVFRTGAGRVGVMDAFCPHLGAHLGSGGSVQGEAIRCPFHHFEFDVAGTCVSTGYGSAPPATAIARTWPAREWQGFVFAFHDHDARPPSWQLPDVDFSEWTEPVTRTYRLRGHPQETTENSVDIGHFEIVHGYRSVTPLQPLRTDGVHLTTRYAVERSFGRLLGEIRTEFEVHVHGLGFSLVDATVADLGVRTRHLVFSTPVGDGEIDLRIALCLHREIDLGRRFPRLAAIPPRMLSTVMPPLLMQAFSRDVRQDFAIWQNKRYLERPALAHGDGPIGPYRRWARQFYE